MTLHDLLTEEVTKLREENIKLRQDWEDMLIVVTNTIQALMNVAKQRRS